MMEFGTDEMKHLVGEILDSYGKYPETCSMDMDNRLNKDIIIDILEKIRYVVFPGFFEVKQLNSQSIEYHLG